MEDLRGHPRKRERAALKSIEKAKQMRRRPDSARWFYSFIPFKVSTGGAAPLIPLLTMALGGGPSDVGIVNAIGSTASMLGGLFWGKLSDKLNRRKVFLIAGFLGTAISTLLFPLARSVYQVMAINAVYTFFIAATIPLPILIITKAFRLEDWDWAIGRFNEISGWAWVGGMVTGLLLGQFLSLRGIFVFLGVIGLLSVPYGLHTIREVPLHLSREKLGVYTGYVVEKFRYIPNMITHLPRFSTGGFGALYLSSLLFWVGAMLYFTQFPVLLKARGFTTSGIYLMSIGNSAVSAFMYTRVGKKLRNGSGYGVLIRGLLLRALAFALVPLAIHLDSMFGVLTFLSYLLAGYTWAFIGISTTSIISREAKPKERGALIGTYNMVSSVGAILGNFASGFVTQSLGFSAEFSLASLLIVLSIVPLLCEKVKSQGE
ncbi:MFS transporter [Thermococcus celer]|uniref:MFS transporter permease n=1 Tax=Thermococcus celer Vu 13 = JCM 8558 TaxID=1293037 RepID=A0A218P146_THECE|nr:MFS transporter [Thermococcus celer]ASI98642.1 MFS transporter permease [Thermococcus celer Vu 13 = JCM 8558]